MIHFLEAQGTWGSDLLNMAHYYYSWFNYGQILPQRGEKKGLAQAGDSLAAQSGERENYTSWTLSSQL